MQSGGDVDERAVGDRRGKGHAHAAGAHAAVVIPGFEPKASGSGEFHAGGLTGVVLEAHRPQLAVAASLPPAEREAGGVERGDGGVLVLGVEVCVEQVVGASIVGQQRMPRLGDGLAPLLVGDQSGQVVQLAFPEDLAGLGVDADHQRKVVLPARLADDEHLAGDFDRTARPEVGKGRLPEQVFAGLLVHRGRRSGVGEDARPVAEEADHFRPGRVEWDEQGDGHEPRKHCSSAAGPFGDTAEVGGCLPARRQPAQFDEPVEEGPSDDDLAAGREVDAID
mgnify:CR=1 FL=1